MTARRVRAAAVVGCELVLVCMTAACETRTVASQNAVAHELIPSRREEAERIQLRLTRISGLPVDSVAEIDVGQLSMIEGQFQNLPAGAELRTATNCGDGPWRLQPFSASLDTSGRFWVEIDGPVVRYPAALQCRVAVAALDPGETVEPLDLASLQRRAFKMTPVHRVTVRPPAPRPSPRIRVTSVAGEPISGDAVVNVGRTVAVEGIVTSEWPAGSRVCAVAADEDARWRVLDCMRPQGDRWVFPQLRLPPASRGPAVTSLVMISLDEPPSAPLMWGELVDGARDHSDPISLHVNDVDMSITAVRLKDGSVFELARPGGRPASLTMPALDDIVEVDVDVYGPRENGDRLFLLIQAMDDVAHQVAVGSGTRVEGHREAFTNVSFPLRGPQARQVALRVAAMTEDVVGRSLMPDDLRRMSVGMSPPVVLPLPASRGAAPQIALEAIGGRSIDGEIVPELRGDVIVVTGHAEHVPAGADVCVGLGGAEAARWRFECAVPDADGAWRVLYDLRALWAGEVVAPQQQFVAIVGSRVVGAVAGSDREFWRTFAVAQTSPLSVTVVPDAMQWVSISLRRLEEVRVMSPAVMPLGMFALLAIGAAILWRWREYPWVASNARRDAKSHAAVPSALEPSFIVCLRQGGGRKAARAVRRYERRMARLKSKHDAVERTLATQRPILAHLLEMANRPVAAVYMSRSVAMMLMPVLFIADLVMNSESFRLFDDPIVWTAILALAVTLAMAICAHQIGCWARQMRPPVLPYVLKITVITACLFGGLFAVNVMRAAYVKTIVSDGGVFANAFISLNGFIVAAAALLIYGSLDPIEGLAERAASVSRLERRENRLRARLDKAIAEVAARRLAAQHRTDELIAYYQTIYQRYAPAVRIAQGEQEKAVNVVLPTPSHQRGHRATKSGGVVPANGSNGHRDVGQTGTHSS